MAVEKTRKPQTYSAETESTGRVQALQAKPSSVKCKKREANESIEMTTGNRQAPAGNEQPGRGQAVRDWFGSSFGRKA